MHNNKKEPDQTTQTGRRQFLKGAMAVSAAAGVAAVSGQSLAATGPVEVATSADSVEGYHETDHIRAYYASCR